MSKILKKITGIVVSKSGDKTIKVSTTTRKQHQKYKKVITVTKLSLVHDEENINSDILKYLNRLSDFLFTLARKLSKDLSVEEIKWIPQKN